MGCPGRQSPASHLPVVRQSSASRSPAQPLASRTPATRQPLACCSLVALLTLTSCRSRPPLAMQMSAAHPQALTRQAGLPAACSAARLPHACLSHACLSPATRLLHASAGCQVLRQPLTSRLPAAHWPLASCAPAARQSLASLSASRSGGSSVQVLPHYFRPGEALSPLSALAVAWMPGSIPGWSPGHPCQQVPGRCRYSLALCISFVRRVCE